MSQKHPSRSHVKQRRSLQNSDPGKILDLIVSLDEDLCPMIQVKINNYLKPVGYLFTSQLIDECEAELALIVVVQGVQGEHKEAYIDAVGTTPLQRKHKILMAGKLQEYMKSSIEHTETLCSLGQDFQSIVTPHLNDQGKKRVVLLSIIGRPFSIVVCVVAPKILEENVSIAIQECFLFVWPTLRKSIALDYECTLKQKCQQLLRVARRLFTQVASLQTLLQIAMDQAKLLTRAEHCSVKLIDMERGELVEMIQVRGAKDDSDRAERSERRFPMDVGITGQVVKTGQLVNTSNVKDNPMFNPDIDAIPGIHCRNLLCFPIREQTGIIGVGQLMNKITDPYFDSMDEEMALAFSIYCGVCIVHSVVYQKMQEAHVRNALANELVMYHMKVADTEVLRILDCTGYHGHPHLANLHFNLRVLPSRELPCYVMRMFSDLGFDKKFHLKPNKLARFILHCKKGYRDVPYHNWFHAFGVAQWAFAAGLNYKLVPLGYLNDLQMMMYVIAGLVHDLDHRGTTNSFHIQGQTTLAALYSSEGSVMERHHLAQAMCILNTEGCDILEALPRRDYDRAIMMLRDYVLASDLANYFKNMNDFMVIANDFQKGNRVHTQALQALLMNAADLSDQLKDWGSVKKTAAAVLTEFFKQGDVEKSRGDLPAIIMDRDRCFIPELEIHFLGTICVPLFNMIGKIIPKSLPAVKIIENHMERWEVARPIFAEVPVNAGLTVLLSPDLDNLIEHNLQEKERLKKEAEEAEREREEAAAAAAAEG